MCLKLSALILNTSYIHIRAHTAVAQLAQNRSTDSHCWFNLGTGAIVALGTVMNKANHCFRFQVISILQVEEAGCTDQNIAKMTGGSTLCQPHTGNVEYELTEI